VHWFPELSKDSSAVLDTSQQPVLIQRLRKNISRSSLIQLWIGRKVVSGHRIKKSAATNCLKKKKKSQTMGEESHNGILEGIAREHLASNSRFGNIFIGGMTWHDE